MAVELWILRSDDPRFTGRVVARRHVAKGDSFIPVDTYIIGRTFDAVRDRLRERFPSLKCTGRQHDVLVSATETWA